MISFAEYAQQFPTYSVICHNLGPLAAFAMKGDAMEYANFYSKKYSVMTGLIVKENLPKGWNGGPET